MRHGAILSVVAWLALDGGAEAQIGPGGGAPAGGGRYSVPAPSGNSGIGGDVGRRGVAPTEQQLRGRGGAEGGLIQLAPGWDGRLVNLDGESRGKVLDGFASRSFDRPDVWQAIERWTASSKYPSSIAIERAADMLPPSVTSLLGWRNPHGDCLNCMPAKPGPTGGSLQTAPSAPRESTIHKAWASANAELKSDAGRSYSEACDRVVPKVMELRTFEQFRNRCLAVEQGAVRAPRTALEKANARSCQAILDEYARACLSENPDPLVAKSVLYRIGVLVRDDPQAAAAMRRQILCSAALLGPSEILTARHCLFETASGQSRRHDLPSLSFLSAGDDRYGSGKLVSKVAGIAFDPGAGTAGFDREDEQNDYVVLSLQSAVEPDLITVAPLQAETPEGRYLPPSTAKLQLAAPQPFRRLLAAGYQVHLMRLAALGTYIDKGVWPTDEEILRSAKWRDFMFIDNAPICFVGPIQGSEKRCLRHACQTEHGMSGAPLLAYDVLRAPNKRPYAITLSLVGVQRRGIELGDRGTCGGSDADAFPNLASIPIVAAVAPFVRNSDLVLR